MFTDGVLSNSTWIVIYPNNKWGDKQTKKK